MFRVAEEQRLEKPSIAFLDRQLIPILCNDSRIDRVNPRDPPPNCINQHALLEQDLNFLLYELSHDPPSQSFYLIPCFPRLEKWGSGSTTGPVLFPTKSVDDAGFLVRSFLSETVTKHSRRQVSRNYGFYQVVLFNFISRTMRLSLDENKIWLRFGLHYYICSSADRLDSICFKQKHCYRSLIWFLWWSIASSWLKMFINMRWSMTVVNLQSKSNIFKIIWIAIILKNYIFV